MGSHHEDMPTPPDVRQPAVKKKTLKRRDFVKVIGLAGAGVLASRYLYLEYRGRPSAGARITVTDTCIGCTGCAVVCPTSAILVVPGGIEASSEKCIGCGYCESACATAGIRVVRPGEPA